MDEDDVAVLAVLANALECVFDVSLRRRVVAAIVHEDQHLVLREALRVDEVVLDVPA